MIHKTKKIIHTIFKQGGASQMEKKNKNSKNNENNNNENQNNRNNNCK